MRRRRPAVEVQDIPEHLDLFDIAYWHPLPADKAHEQWLEARREWIAAHPLFPLELCDGDYFDGTGSEFVDAREAWEALHDRELPWPERVPDDPFDPDDV
ncbi:hypothetical protein [Demequina sp. NBRC 110053]|uniref:hypothetical protein n=1 Tax=Demequina sp. NBRC 110053 TaxID=1570342 RepID=UPI0009FCC42F|nr:hypothetical protein [Demequina sp. NBRC 110053]